MKFHFRYDMRSCVSKEIGQRPDFIRKSDWNSWKRLNHVAVCKRGSGTNVDRFVELSVPLVGALVDRASKREIGSDWCVFRFAGSVEPLVPGKPPQWLVDSFLAAGLPLANDVRVEVSNNGWILRDDAQEFAIRPKAGSLFSVWLDCQRITFDALLHPDSPRLPEEYRRRPVIHSPKVNSSDRAEAEFMVDSKTAEAETIRSRRPQVTRVACVAALVVAFIWGGTQLVDLARSVRSVTPNRPDTEDHRLSNDQRLLKYYLEIARPMTGSPEDCRIELELSPTRCAQIKESTISADLEATNNDALIGILLARAFFESGQPRLAARQLDAMTLNPRPVAQLIAFSERGLHHYEHNEFDLAEESFNQAEKLLTPFIEEAPSNVDHFWLFRASLLNNMGNNYVQWARRGDHQRAEQLYNEANDSFGGLRLQLDEIWLKELLPELRAKLYANRGDLLARDEQRWAAAEDDYDRSITFQAVSLAEKHRLPSPWFNSAWILANDSATLEKSLERVTTGLQILVAAPTKQQAEYYDTAAFVFDKHGLGAEAIANQSLAMSIATNGPQRTRYGKKLEVLRDKYDKLSD